MSRNFDSIIGEFQISDIDESSATAYYGYLDRYGNWLIKEVTDTTIRYCRGEK